MVRVAVLLWGTGGLVFACGDDEKDPRLGRLAAGCVLSSDCDEPLVCVFEKCHTECEQDRDCPGEARCVRGGDGHVCQLPQDTACSLTSDCRGDQVCGVDGECRDECTTDTDCTRGQICAQSRQCASSEPNKDLVDDDGNILVDPFDDTGGGGGASGGASGSGGGGGAAGDGGTSGTGGAGGGGGASGTGGAADAGSTGGVAGTGGVDAGMSSGGSPNTGGADASTDASLPVEAGPGDSGPDGSSERDASDSGCPPGFADCTADPGCETNLSLIFSCGSCSTSCDDSHGDVQCQDQQCVVVTCDSTYDTCDGDPDNGCETPINTDTDCGRCDRDCSAAGSTCNTTRNCAAVTLLPNFTHSTPSGFNDRTWTVANGSIYHGGYSNYVVRRIPVADPTSFVALWDGSGATLGLESLLVNGDDVFWAARAGADRRVLTKPFDADAAVVPTTAWTPEYHVEYLRRQGTAYYWITGAYQAGEPAYVYARSVSAPASSPGSRIVDVSQGTHGEIAAFEVSSDAIYWISLDADSGTARDVRMVPIDGDPDYVPTSVSGAEVAPNLNGPFALATFGNAAYFVRDVNNAFTDGIYRYRRGESIPTDPIVFVQDATDVLVDATGIYYVASNRLHRAPLDGGAGVPILEANQPVTLIIGQDATSLYAVYYKQSAPAATTIYRILK